MPDLAEGGRLAQAEAFAAQGELREPYGGAVATPRDLVLMVAGFDAPGVNSGDVVGPDPDLEAARAFFAGRASWGLRVPVGQPWQGGRWLLQRRLMVLLRDDFRPAPVVPGLALRRAGPDDLATVLGIDSAAFGLALADNERWLEPLLAADQRVLFALATLDGEAVATAYTLRTDGAAGPCLYLAGVAVLPAARRRGVGAAISTWLLAQGLAAGAELAHLNPDTDAAARLYGRLGFTETSGYDIYVDL